MGGKIHQYLSTLIVVIGVPLSYVVREKENPDAEWDFPKFIDKTIACASLKGNYYEADHHTVHKALLSFKTGHP